MVKYVLLVALTLIAATISRAQTIVKDSLDGNPIMQASVFDERGCVLGVTDMEGRLPVLNNTQKIRINHIAYKTKDVDVRRMGNEIRLSPNAYQIREVVKEKEKPHCLKLTCYMRIYTLNDGITQKNHEVDLPPILSFKDGIYHLYLFSDESIHQSKARPLVVRNVLDGNEADGGREMFYGLNLRSKVERFKGKNYELRGDNTKQDIYRVKKKETYQIGVLKRDTANKLITVSEDFLAPKGTYKYNIGISKATWTVWNYDYLYRLTPYDKVGQGDLLAYREVVRMSGGLPFLKPGVQVGTWKYVEFFTYDAEYLTKEEYKADKNEVKQSSMTMEDIDRIKNEIGVPALTDEIEQKLAASRLWLEEARKKKL